MDEIYRLVGQMVEACQYIEGIFQQIIAFQKLLESDYDDEKETINGIPLQAYVLEHQGEIVNDCKKAYETCLGNATSNAFSMLEFPPNLVNAIMKIIKERNQIIHCYFKETDFYTHWNNDVFLKGQAAYLQKRVIKARNVCDQLRVAIGAQLWEDRWDKKLGDHKKLKDRR